jgi:hypothetical protein
MEFNIRQYAYFVFIIFTLYGLNSVIFERKLFFNEILSFCGLITFLLFSFRKYPLFLLPSSNIFRLVLCVLSLGIVHLFFSLLYKTNFYFYFRNSSIVYSIFSFFIGFYLFDYFLDFLSKTRRVLRLYFGLALLHPMPFVLLDRFTGALFFPWLFNRSDFKTLLLIILVSMWYAIAYSSLTVIIITSFVILIYFIRSYNIFKYLTVSAFIVFLSIYTSLIPNFTLYKSTQYSLFGNIKRVADSHFLLGLDGNTTWRSIFWYRVTLERFPSNISGIGFGTPLIDYKHGFSTAADEHDDEYDAHVTGSHNTYLTLSVRLGILFPMFMLLIYREIFKEYFLKRTYYYEKNFYFFFWSFFSITMVGLFNLLLESPTVASLYWILLGFVANIIEKRKMSTKYKLLV